MEYLGIDNNRKTFWWEYSENNFHKLPDKDWICFVIEEGLPQGELFEKFVRVSIQKNILEFKAFGKHSTSLDDSFDEIAVVMDVNEGYPQIEVITTWHDDEGLASAFWQCFHATSLPDGANYDDLKIICFHLDNIDLTTGIKNYIKLFNDGWLPSEEE